MSDRISSDRIASDRIASGRIDLNADVGESLGPWPMGADAELIPLVSSVNIACGFHAGDPLTIRRTVRLALDAGVSIGAHPGYPDLVGFGRRPMSIAPDELEAALLYQVAALRGIVMAEGGRLAHVKPHGALYHQLSVDRAAAQAVARALVAIDPTLRVVGAPGAVLLEEARRRGLATDAEGFADRVYEPDGRLRPRTLPGSLHESPEAAAAQALSIARGGHAFAHDGTPVAVPATTICLHGDTPGAPHIAAVVRAVLAEAGFEVRAPDA